MDQGNPIAKDMFVRAREAFFGVAKAPPKPSAPLAERLIPRNEPRVTKAHRI